MDSPFDDLKKLSKEVKEGKYLPIEQYPIVQSVEQAEQEKIDSDLRSEVNQLKIHKQLETEKLLNKIEDFKRDINQAFLDMNHEIRMEYENSRMKEFDDMFDRTPIKIFNFMIVWRARKPKKVAYE